MPAQPCLPRRLTPLASAAGGVLLRCVRKMPALEECLQRADDYLKLAGETDLVYARVALVELAAEFLELAEELARARESER
jgi:predicted lysophospholipase L1 biosynthesis ABC-type transport system permease subunit